MKLWARNPQRRFSRFDMFVYWLFHKRWSRHFEAYPDLRREFIGWMQEWDRQRSLPLGKLRLVSHNPNPRRAGTSGEKRAGENEGGF